jgi:hypothetical protein
MVTNKMMSVAERSFLTVASLTFCLTSDRVLAREMPSQLNQIPNFHDPLLPTNFKPHNVFGSRLPNDFDNQQLADRFHHSPVEIEANASLSVESKIADRSTTPVNRALSPQIDVSHNPDLANIISYSRLSTAIDRAQARLAPNPRHQELRPKKLTKSAKISTIARSAPQALFAQATPNSLPPAEIDDLVRQISNSLTPNTQDRRVAPAISYVTPIGYGGYFGNVGLGVAYQSSTALGNKDDANFGATVSLGDPSKYVGVDLSLAVNSVSNETNRGGGGSFGSNTLSLQVSRLISDDLSIGIGAENLLAFNPSERNISTTLSYYFVTTKIIPLNSDSSRPFSTLYASLGLGNGRFLPAGKVTVKGEPGVNVFGSAAIKVIDGVNGIVEWSGQDVDVAVSIVPFRNIPLAITPAIVDLMGTSQNRGARFNISAGYSFKF